MILAHELPDPWVIESPKKIAFLFLVGLPTLTFAVAVLPLFVLDVIVVVPSLSPFTLPLLTVAILLFELDQVTSLLVALFGLIVAFISFQH